MSAIEQINIEVCKGLGIKPNYHCDCPVNTPLCLYGGGCGHAKPCCPREKVYPEITAEIKLELILLIMNAIKKKFPNTAELSFYLDDDFTDQILQGAIQFRNEIRAEVRMLFGIKEWTK